MSDDTQKCPYCKAEFEVCHDDGCYYTEGKHEYQCEQCEEWFLLETIIDHSHATHCTADRHKWIQTDRFGSQNCWPDKAYCDCANCPKTELVPMAALASKLQESVPTNSEDK